MISDHDHQAGQMATVDSIDQGLARILIGPEASMEIVPLNRLPNGTVEGDTVTVFMPESGDIAEATFSNAPGGNNENPTAGDLGSLDLHDRDY
ncbi:hypothetical protein LRD18_07155 [Halorhodospira halochloris]|uniref:Uncharacterized protein n=1 Tax=Halorhodospira halochloris TaxID=1052 RepID=A0A0X8X9B7_HALHR|nr:hypothetical protein [Halorhodospira halochloris]MBK1652531.1 hypothetical protein [Halorhodospira halochloris]MCG5530651.1 hypothetical protein [Halorhodospira halochloris]MCG5548715.1 hypothetical protein [Halorhodospira halochloris]BAU57856.1 hypothetical protein HH1059_11630 [Halorhodospira halochloris]